MRSLLLVETILRINSCTEFKKSGSLHSKDIVSGRYRSGTPSSPLRPTSHALLQPAQEGRPIMLSCTTRGFRSPLFFIGGD